MPRYCRTCVLPDTRPGVVLDDSGQCNGCCNSSTKQAIDWPARAQAFKSLAKQAQARSTTHDCVIPISGGKDSFWQVVTCLEHDLNPLCVTYVYPNRSEVGQRNLRTLTALGVDHIELRLNPGVERALIGKTFRETGISGLVTHMAIYAYPMQVAAAHGIPLVVYGENSAFEYGTDDATLTGARVDRRWLDRFGVTQGTTAADWVDDELTAKRLAPLFLPSDERLSDGSLSAIFLGHYFPWDPQTSLSIALANGFERRAEGPRVGHYDFVNIDDDMIGVHHHLKWHKFGITRSWDTLSMEIRSGRLTRAQAIERLQALGDETPWDDIRMFCEYLAMSETDYFETANRFRNPAIWTRRADRWVIDGFLLPDYAWPADHEAP